jgi:RHS repeat-associated protein
VLGAATDVFGATTRTGSALFQYGAFATSNTCGAITFSGNSSTDSFDSSQGTYAATKQSNGGNIGTNGNIQVSGNVKVNGTASSPKSGTGQCSNQSLTALTSSGKASISEGLVLLATSVTYAAPPLPNPLPFNSPQNISGACSGISSCTTLNGTKNLSLAPGQYGNVHVSGGTTVHLQAGTYNFNTLSLSGNSNLVVDSTPVNLSFAGQGLSGNDAAADLSGGSMTNPTGKPNGFQMLYAGKNAIKLSGGSGSYGLVYAPNADVVLSGGSDWYGAIIAFTLTDSGNTAIHYDRALGSTPLAITATADTPSNSAGWNNSNVFVTFTCSGVFVTACPAPVTVAAEGANQQVSGTVRDVSGNDATVSLTINLDKTPPTVTTSRLPGANAAGWNNTNVTATFLGNDTLSGIAACSPPITLSKEASNQLASGICTDVAGNTSPPATINGINIDKTPPTLTFGSLNPLPNLAGWNNTNVAFSFTTGDNLSGVASTSVPNPLVLSVEGLAVTGNVTVTDIAGNAATFNSPSAKIDKTPPTALVTASPLANSAGWNNTNVTVSFTGIDALSGLASCTTPITLNNEGVNQSAAGTCMDKAGNASPVATLSTINIDKTPPVMTITSPANGATVNPGSIVANGTATDQLSGAASVTCNGTAATLIGSTFSCVVPIVIGPNSIAVQAFDAAGNMTQATAALQGGIPEILTVSPNTGQQGQTNLSINLTGQFTQWAQGTTTASFGAGISVTNVTATDATHLTAQLSIAAVAGTGTRDLTVTTGAEVASLQNAFTVVAPLNQPPSVSAGPDRFIYLPSVATLNGTFSDDGLPAGATLSADWSVVSGPVSTDSQAWRKLNPLGNSPSPRSDGSTVFDPASKRLIIFGGNYGVSTNLVTNDVWVLVNADGLGGDPQWIQLSPTGVAPSARRAHAAVYDSTSNRMMVFGGVDPSGFHNDVWILTNANGLGGTPTWIQLSPAGTLPSPRRLMGLAYDASSNRMMMFGGCLCNHTSSEPLLSDTWVLTNANGTDAATPTWTELIPTGPQPAGRSNAVMSFDPASNRLIVFGGGDVFHPSLFNDTWVLINANGLGGNPGWIQTVPDGSAQSPSQRTSPGGVYNPTNNRLTILGGINSCIPDSNHCIALQDAWYLSNANGLGGASTWVQVSPSGGPAVPGGQVVYDAEDDRAIEFGGGGTFRLPFQFFNDTWVLTNATNTVAAGSPGTVTFGTPVLSQSDTPETVYPATTTATFSSPGVWVVRLTASDSQLSSSADATVTVQIPGFTSISPSSGQQGQTSVPITILAQGTHFSPSSVVDMGGGITLTNVTASDVDTLSAQMTISTNAPTGAHRITVTSGAETVFLDNAFIVTAGTPVLTTANPNTGQQGQTNLSVNLTGQFTHWVQGTTTASFGTGIAVATLMVNSATTVTAILNIDGAAGLGSRNVTVTTGTEVVTLSSGFTVTAGAPVLQSVNPNSGQQGQQSLSVMLTAQFTHWIQGTTTASFGSGITVASMTVNSPSTATAVLNIDPTASTGTRTVAVTTGMEVATLSNGFAVNALTTLPILLFNTGVSGNSVPLIPGAVDPHYQLIQSADTSFPGPAAYVADQSLIPPWLPNGPNSAWISPRPITTTPITAVGNYVYRTTFDLTGFLPDTARITGTWLIDDGGLDILINGVSTGIAAPPLPCACVATFTTWRPFTISTGFVSGLNTLDFIVQNGTAPQPNPTGLRVELQGAASLNPSIPLQPITALNPNVGQQGQNISIVISGQNTHFVQGTTTASFGAGITDISLTINSPISATAVIDINAETPVGTRTVILTTGNEMAAPAAGFTVLPGTPAIVHINPNTSSQGQTNLSVNLTGQFTHFAQGVTRADFGAGITVVSLTANSATSATALLNIDPSASIGSRNVTVTTGSEVASLINGFIVTSAVNQPPSVSAGADQTVNLYAAATLAGTVTDDGLPIGGALTVTWSTVSGPGIVTFANANAAATTATFCIPGTYTLRLTASDSALSASDDVVVTVTPGPDQFQVLKDFNSTHSVADAIHIGDNFNDTRFIPPNPSGITYAFSVKLCDNAPNGTNVQFQVDQYQADNELPTDYSFATVKGQLVGFLSSNLFIEDLTGHSTFPVVTDTFSIPAGILHSGDNIVEVTMGWDSGRGGGYDDVDLTNVRVKGLSNLRVEVNQVPIVNAGPNLTASVATLFGLNGAVSDDGLPPGSTLTTSWSKVSGTGSIAFVNPASSITTATASQPGTYVLRLSANDSELTGSTDVVVSVSPPSTVSISPNIGFQKQTNLAVTITGSNTHFSGTSVVDLGQGIVVNNLSAVNATQLTAQLTIASTAAPIARNLTVTTGSEVVTSPSAFLVKVSLIDAVVPNSGQLGESFPIAITGLFTHFAQGMTSVSLGAGITVNSITVINATSLTANISIAVSGAVGLRDVTATTGPEVAILKNGFSVIGTAIPSIMSVSPNSGPQGQGGPVGIVGQNTNFVQGTTTIDFGPGITVSNVSVTCPTCLTVQVQITASAVPGPRTITVTTGSEVAALTYGFTVLPGTPILTSLVPAGGQQGQTTNLTITGRFTNFVQGTSQASFGKGISVGAGSVGAFGPITVISPTTAVAQINVDACAPIGLRMVTVQTGAESATMSAGFAVTAVPTLQAFTEYPLPALGSYPDSLTSGPDNCLWFAELNNPKNGGNRGDKVARITTTGVISEFLIDQSPEYVAAGSDGNVWVAEYFNQTIARVTTAGTVTRFTTEGYPFGITSGPDGNLWFTERYGNKIGRITPSGLIAEFPVPTAAAEPQGITAGPDGNIWFTEGATSKIGRITLDGVITEFPSNGTYPYYITSGPDSNLWFTDGIANTISKITPAGSITNFPIPTSGSGPSAITVGPDGNLWFTEVNANKIGKMTTAGVASEFVVPTSNSAPAGIAVGPDGNLWFTEGLGNKIVKVNIALLTSAPSLLSVNPNSGFQGQTGLAVTLSGQLTNWAQGATTVDFGPGIIVNSLGVTNATTLVAVISITGTAPLGFRQITITTGAETASLANGFLVSTAPLGSVISSVSPDSGQQGQGGPIAIVGQNTHFLQDTTQLDLGAGITINSVSVSCSTCLTAQVTIAENAPPGSHDVTVTTGTEVVTLAGGFTVQPGTPFITSFGPTSIQQGQQSVTLTVTGKFTHFTQGTTQVSLGSGITINSVAVSSQTALTAQISADDAAMPGIRTLSVSTGSETVSVGNVFTVKASPPVLLSATPNTGTTGQQHLQVILTGRFTNWTTGSSTAIFGAGVTVIGFFVNTATNAAAVVSIDTAAVPGPRTITVTTGAEVASLVNGFTVNGPFISTIAPGGASQGVTNLAVQITGTNTHFAQGTSIASFGDGITVLSTTVANATTASAVINLAVSAALGSRTVTLTTGNEVASLVNGFIVTSGLPVFVSATPNSATQGQQNVSVSLAGQFTNWVQGTTTASFGAGITVHSLTVTSSINATAIVNIDSAAVVGSRTITLITGTEIDTLSAGFTITATGPNQPPNVNAGPNQTIQLGANLVQNPGADSPVVSGSIPGWTVVSGNWTQAPAGTGTFPLSADGNTYFYAGQVASAELDQDLDFSSFAGAIDAGQQQIELKAQMYVLAEPVPDSGRVQFDFLDATKQFVIASSFFQSAGSGNIWTPASRVRSVPAQTRWVRVRLIATMNTGPSNDAYFDSLSVRALSAGTILNGTATDDGLPPGSTLTTSWNAVSGPGTVTFANPSTPVTAASFSTTGVYVLGLTASDTALTSSSNVTITVNPGNQPPSVDAGPDLAITYPATAALVGMASDDGLPLGSTVAISWGQVSGPGTVSFNPPAAASTTATFSAPGIYVVRLTASDSQYSVNSYATVIVSPPVTGPPPTVVITSPTEGGAVTSPTNVVGTVTSATLASWQLTIGRSDVATPTVLASGTGAVNNGTLGLLDPTLLLNGQAQLVLTATDTGGQTSILTVDVLIDRNQKIGNFTVSFDDLTVPVAGLPIDIVRTYDSRDKRKGDFGVGWQLSIKNVELQKTGALGANWIGTTTGGAFPTYCIQPANSKTVTVTMPDGKVLKFDPQLSLQCQQLVPPQSINVQFQFTPEPGTTAQLVPLDNAQVFVNGSFPGPIELLDLNTFAPWDDQHWRLILQDGRSVDFDQVLGLQTITDLNGNSLTFSSAGIIHSTGKSVTFQRDSIGRITQITDPDGNAMVYAYSVFGDLAAFTDRQGNTTTYSYDSNHGLLTIQDPRGIDPIRNIYDDSGRLIQHIDAFGNVINYTHNIGARQDVITDRLGNVTVYAYDTDGNIIQTTDPLGGVTQRTYDSHDNLLTETDPLGRQKSYTYDSQDNRLTETDGDGNTTAYTYNSHGQVLTTTDPLGNVTTNSYDTNGNLISTRDAIGNVTSSTYNAAGLRTSMTDPLNEVTTYAYDGSGNLTQQMDPAGHATNYTYDPNGNRLTQAATRTTGAGTETLTTSYQYDKLNRLTQTTYPDGSSTQTAYNSIGKQSATIDQLGRQTTYQYDDLGRLSQTNYPDSTSESSTYDAENHRISGTDRGGRTTSFTYDALGRLTRTTFPDTALTTTAYDSAGQIASTVDQRGNVTKYSYDAAGRRTQVTNALNQNSGFAYDAVGNQTSMTDANGNITQYQYDGLNRRTKGIYPDSTFDQTDYDALGRTIRKIDQAGNATQYGYDALGRLLQVTDALSQITRYGYDELGNRVSQADADNHTTLFEYDKLGRRTKRTLPLGMFETSTYDAAGNQVSKTDFNGKSTTYTYDAVNRLTRKVPDTSLSDPAESYTYTASGQRASMTDASGTTTYHYDSRDRLLQKATPEGTLTYTYDAAGNLLTLRSSNTNGASVDYAYDALNRPSTVTDQRLASGSNTTTYAYDPVGNLQTYVYPNGVRTTHTYNPLNRLTNLAIDKSGSGLAQYAYTLGATGNRTAVAELGGRQVNYTYDALYRLTDEAIANSAITGAIHYTYDSVGNRLSRASTVSPVPAATYSYDQNDRLATDTYDANGNTTNSGSTEYTYDFENRLKSQNSPAVSIVYDGDGNRVAKTAGGVTTQYLVDDRNLTGYAQVLEEIQSGAVQRVYTYGLNRISQSQASGTSFYAYDGHASVRVLMDSTGAVTDRYDYDAFGNVLSQTGSTPNVYLYSGEQNDVNLGLYYLRARYLSQSTGRFWTMDAFVGLPRAPISLHKFLYAGANPISNHDPSGRQFVSTIDVALFSITLPEPIVRVPASFLRRLTQETELEVGGCPAGSDNFYDRIVNGFQVLARGPETGNGYGQANCHVNAQVVDVVNWKVQYVELNYTAFDEEGGASANLGGDPSIASSWLVADISELVCRTQQDFTTVLGMHGSLAIRLQRLADLMSAPPVE